MQIKKNHTEKRVYFQDAEGPLDTRRILFKNPYTKIRCGTSSFPAEKEVNSCHKHSTRDMIEWGGMLQTLLVLY